jgi:two-component system, LytTR family, response regulator
MAEPIRTVIAEDEPLAARRLRELIADEPDLQLTGEARDGAEAARLIDELKPDLVFLDVRMPGVSGLETLERIRHRPAVVFTTAYDQYALAAFELAAVDYLLKPFGQERFREALTRVRRLLGNTNGSTALERAQETLARRPLTRLFVRERDATRPLAVSSIDRLEARDDYVAVHAQGRMYLLNIPLQKLEERLDPEVFVRVHRSHIVNLDRITAIHSHDAARLIVELSDGARIVASRSGTQRLRQLTSPDV